MTGQPSDNFWVALAQARPFDPRKLERDLRFAAELTFGVVQFISAMNDFCAGRPVTPQGSTGAPCGSGSAASPGAASSTEAPPRSLPADVHSDVVEAAGILGVPIDATADAIRAALRAKLRDSGLHPDHGGDGEGARRLIDAQNLLIARLKVCS